MTDASEPANPWTRLDSRAIYENPWIAVREDRVIRPDGQPGIYGVVHFKNKAVGILPVEADGSIWLVGQHRYPARCLFLGDPRGGRTRGGRPCRHRPPRASRGDWDHPRQGRVDRPVAPLELGERRTGLSVPRHRLDAGSERARRDREVAGPAVRLADRLGDGPGRPDHRFDDRHRVASRGGQARLEGEFGGMMDIQRSGFNRLFIQRAATCWEPKIACEGKFWPGQAVGPVANSS